MSPAETDIQWMRKALKLAQTAEKAGEVPVGAILVDNQGQVVSEGINRRETWKTPLGHAELLAIHRAARKRQSWRLNDLTLYVTLEPCPMCAGLIVQSRLQRIVYGAKDPKAGAVESLYQICGDKRLNHQVDVTAGVLEDECSALLKEFFQRRRRENKSKENP